MSASWEKHPGGTFHIWALSPNTYLNRAIADGSITLYTATVDDEVQASASIKLGDDMRAGLLEALTTEPETVPATALEDVSIFGQSRFIVDKLTKILRGAAGKHHNYGSVRETWRGSYFDLELLVDDEPTGHVARVSVDLSPWGTAAPALATEPDDEELEP